MINGLLSKLCGLLIDAMVEDGEHALDFNCSAETFIICNLPFFILDARI